MTTALRRFFFLVLTVIAALPLFVPLAAPAKRLPETPPDGWPAKFVVEVVGREFRWHFRYLEPDGVPLKTAGTTTIDELHLPVGASVELRFTSEDYIYLCSVPELGIEQIAVPGLTHHCVCELVEPATYELLVDPLCSFRFYHDELMGRIVVEEDIRFIQSTESI